MSGGIPQGETSGTPVASLVVAARTEPLTSSPRRRPRAGEAIDNPRKLFPKSGQVEMLGVVVSTLCPGDWLAFQVVSSARPGAPSFKISAHRLMPRYVDMAYLGSIEAARVVFSEEGWVDGRQPGHWAVRSRRIALWSSILAGTDQHASCDGSGLQHVPCYEFAAARIMLEPGTSTRSTSTIWATPRRSQCTIGRRTRTTSRTWSARSRARTIHGLAN